MMDISENEVKNQGQRKVNYDQGLNIEYTRCPRSTTTFWR